MFSCLDCRRVGHDLNAGKRKVAITGEGTTVAYAHNTTIELRHPVTAAPLLSISEIEVDYLENLKVALLGVNHFLAGYVLNIDYPNKYFSINLLFQ